MGDAGLLELIAFGRVAGPGVEVAHPHLGVELDLGGAGGGRLGVGGLEQLGPHPAPARGARDGHPLQHHAIAAPHQPAGRDDRPRVVDGHQMKRRPVVPVPLERLGHPLLLAEDRPPQLQRRGQVRAARAPDRRPHALVKPVWRG
jgi:hypothetical protein